MIIKTLVGILAVSLMLTACTVRGGWPRFLRPGEASDAEMDRENKISLRELLARQHAWSVAHPEDKGSVDRERELEALLNR